MCVKEACKILLFHSNRYQTPTFVVFVNEPSGVHFSYKRYLMNGFRERLGFEGVPLQILFRKKR
ncbi:MAG: hypothetical protein IPJ69_14905 [Deltaproteobacteria bacterium]|nr:MAG: hypothetical protein IPJ69_14905 [Deltaproteobacteria bacterium]